MDGDGGPPPPRGASRELPNYRDIYEQSKSADGYSPKDISRRAVLGWGSSFASCLILEFAGCLAWYQKGMMFAISCQIIVLIFIVVFTNLFFSWRGSDKHRQHWLLNIVFVLAVMFGFMGGLLGGHYFSQYGLLAERHDYKMVDPSKSPLELKNPGKIEFMKGTNLRPTQMGAAQYTSTNRLENRFRWYACATPIVGPKTGNEVGFWAITEGMSPCTAPPDCVKGRTCVGYVLAREGHAASAVSAAQREYGIPERPGATYVSWNVEPEAYTSENLGKAWGSVLMPLFLFPAFGMFIHYIISLYEAVYYMPVTGAMFPKYQ